MIMKPERVKSERQKVQEWIYKLKSECKGLTPAQKDEMLKFTKYSAWKAIEDKFLE